MANKQRTAWNDTEAGQMKTGNLLKLENLLETAFSIVDVAFEDSAFDPEKEVARISITLDEDDGTEMEDFEYQILTTQTRILQRMHKLTAEQLPIGPITVIETGQDKRFDTVYYDFANTVPEIDTPKPIYPPKRASGQVMGRVAQSRKVDVSTDAQRQRLAGNGLRSKSAQR